MKSMSLASSTQRLLLAPSFPHSLATILSKPLVSQLNSILGSPLPTKFVQTRMVILIGKPFSLWQVGFPRVKKQLHSCIHLRCTLKLSWVRLSQNDYGNIFFQNQSDIIFNKYFFIRLVNYKKYLFPFFNIFIQ